MCTHMSRNSLNTYRSEVNEHSEESLHHSNQQTRQSPIKSKVKWSRYRSGVALRVSRGIALLFHDRGTRRGWLVSITPRPHFTPWKDPVPIVQEAGWAPWPIWTGGKSRPHRDSIPDRPALSQSLYRLSYPAHRQSPIQSEKYHCRIDTVNSPDDGHIVARNM